MGRVYVPVFGSSGDFVPTAGGGAGFSNPIFNHAENALGGTSIAVTLNGIVAGSLVVCIVSVRDDGPTDVSSVVDDLAVGAVQNFAHLSGAGDRRIQYWSFINHSGGNRTFTANFSASGPFRKIHVIAVSGGATATFHGSAEATGTSVAPSSGNVSPAPSVNGELILGGAICDDVISGATAPFTIIQNDATGGGLASSYYIQPTAAAVSADFSSANDVWRATAVNYKP